MGVATHIVGAGAGVGVSEVGESVGQQYWYTMYVPMNAPVHDASGPAGVYAVEVYAPKLIANHPTPQSAHMLIEPPLPPQIQDVPEPSWAVIVAICLIILYLLHDEENGGDNDNDD